MQIQTAIGGSGPGFVLAMVAHLYEVSPRDLRSRSRRGAQAAFARQVAMYLTHVVYGLTMKEAARAIGRDASTAVHACHRIEDLRDDPQFDRQLTQIENVLRQAAKIEVLS